jgi:hypothetical protein
MVVNMALATYSQRRSNSTGTTRMEFLVGTMSSSPILQPITHSRRPSESLGVNCQTLFSASQVSRIARSLASIPPNAIPIPSEAKVWATQPRAANVAPRCVIRTLTFVPVTKGVAVATKQPNRDCGPMSRFAFPIPHQLPQQLLRGDGGVRDGVRSACFNPDSARTSWSWVFLTKAVGEAY